MRTEMDEQATDYKKGGVAEIDVEIGDEGTQLSQERTSPPFWSPGWPASPIQRCNDGEFVLAILIILIIYIVLAYMSLYFVEEEIRSH
jgi:hypothetical protein